MKLKSFSQTHSQEMHLHPTQLLSLTALCFSPIHFLNSHFNFLLVLLTHLSMALHSPTYIYCLWLMLEDKPLEGFPQLHSSANLFPPETIKLLHPCRSQLLSKIKAYFHHPPSESSPHPFGYIFPPSSFQSFPFLSSFPHNSRSPSLTSVTTAAKLSKSLC